MSRRCERCGAGVEARYRFCGACGAPVGEPSDGSGEQGVEQAPGRLRGDGERDVERTPTPVQSSPPAMSRGFGCLVAVALAIVIITATMSRHCSSASADANTRGPPSAGQPASPSGNAGAGRQWVEVVNPNQQSGE